MDSFYGSLSWQERSPSAHLIGRRIFSGVNESAWVRLTCFKDGRDLLNRSRREPAERELRSELLGCVSEAPLLQNKINKMREVGVFIYNELFYEIMLIYRTFSANEAWALHSCVTV